MLVSVEDAVERLRREEVVALPTETVYGLAGRIDSPTALDRIFSVKQRPFFDPLIVHVATAADVAPLVTAWPRVYEILTARFWPGPLTLIAPRAPRVSEKITSGLPAVAVRCPNHPLTLEVLRALGVPLAAPSANRFGRTSPTRAAHVEAEFGGQVPVVDGGECGVGVESTVLSAATDARGRLELKILRPGGISREDLRAALNGETYILSRATSAESPGNLPAHYQPDSSLFILNDADWSPAAAAVLGWSPASVQELRLPESPTAAARVLYQELRRLSRGPRDVIWIRRTPAHQTEVWEAVWDRIDRAASFRL